MAKLQFQAPGLPRSRLDWKGLTRGAAEQDENPGEVVTAQPAADFESRQLAEAV